MELNSVLYCICPKISHVVAHCHERCLWMEVQYSRSPLWWTFRLEMAIPGTQDCCIAHKDAPFSGLMEVCFTWGAEWEPDFSLHLPLCQSPLFRPWLLCEEGSSDLREQNLEWAITVSECLNSSFLHLAFLFHNRKYTMSELKETLEIPQLHRRRE